MHTEKRQQGSDMVLVAVGVLAAKASKRVEFVRLKIGCPIVHCVGVFPDPWAGYVVAA